LARAAHQLARDEARDQAQHNPGNNRHFTSPPLLASLTLYVSFEHDLIGNRFPLFRIML
jgi:hypothetical protein